ncbi:MAG: hypothetical protein CL608_06380 [Anaerolineaceae bacterium]|nr:hypothetical protein [Anaerolineaceae bacterium]
MSVQVTLSLPNNMVEHAKQLGTATKRNTAEVLADALEMMWPTLSDSPTSDLPAVETLSDEDVLMLADMKLDQTQNERLGELQSKGKESTLSEVERFELLSLLQIYQLGQLRKSEALAEAVRRGLRTPLSS